LLFRTHAALSRPRQQAELQRSAIATHDDQVVHEATVREASSGEAPRRSKPYRTIQQNLINNTCAEDQQREWRRVRYSRYLKNYWRQFSWLVVSIPPPASSYRGCSSVMMKIVLQALHPSRPSGLYVPGGRHYPSTVHECDSSESGGCTAPDNCNAGNSKTINPAGLPPRRSRRNLSGRGAQASRH